ncbi:MAG: site-2 protease family protein [Nocardioides sp.]
MSHHAVPEESLADRDRVPTGSLRLGRIAGCDVIVSRTWFLVAGLIAIVVAPQAEAVRPGLGPWQYVVGLGFAVLLYASVLLHEISHAVMARRFGFPVSSITLHFLGGMTAVRGEAHRPREEFWIAVVGPITSLAVGGVGFLVLPAVPPGLLAMAVSGVAYSNLLIGVLNLVPGLPLDGGRVLRSFIWAVTHNAHLGTLVAGWLGRGLAVLALVWPFLLPRVTGRPADLSDYFMAVILAGFLWMGASGAMASARFRRRIPALVARELAEPAHLVNADLPLAEALRQAQEAGSAYIVVTTGDGQPERIVSPEAVAATPLERRPWMPVASVARPLGPGTMLPVDIKGEELIIAMGRRPAEEYLLVDDAGRAQGVLVTAAVDQAFREGPR